MPLTWGRVGKKYFSDACKLYVYELGTDWITCKKCHLDFMPLVNKELLDKFLKHYREYGYPEDDLYICKDCGGIDYKEKNFPEQMECKYSEEEILSVIREGYEKGIADAKAYFEKDRWIPGRSTIITYSGEIEIIQKLRRISENQKQGKYSFHKLPFTVSVGTHADRISIYIEPKKPGPGIPISDYEPGGTYKTGITDTFRKYGIKGFYVNTWID